MGEIKQIMVSLEGISGFMGVMMSYGSVWYMFSSPEGGFGCNSKLFASAQWI